ncbi:hypothetical protein [Hylemonella gracilis]|uniref:hypothetical protein n=1 Tax=Hylemonella gracilis TaxID=80880 RepID=UPI001F610854
MQLQVTMAPNLPPIWVHPALVEQALFNVLENAAKFPPGGTHSHHGAPGGR